jgi:ADP-ribosylglycohydrolase
VRAISTENRPAFNILSTIGVVYAIFLRDQAFSGLQKAVSIGGDTDSYGATIGGMIGALRGPFYESRYWDGIDPRYRAMTDESILQMKKLIPKSI